MAGVRTKLRFGMPELQSHTRVHAAEHADSKESQTRMGPRQAAVTSLYKIKHHLLLSPVRPFEADECHGPCCDLLEYGIFTFTFGRNEKSIAWSADMATTARLQQPSNRYWQVISARGSFISSSQFGDENHNTKLLGTCMANDKVENASLAQKGTCQPPITCAPGTCKVMASRHLCAPKPDLVRTELGATNMVNAVDMSLKVVLPYESI